MNILTFYISKGGSGKTTCSLNMAYALGELGERVLLIDLDPQGSLSKLMLKEPDTIKYMTMFDVHTRNLDIKDILFDDETYHVSLLPSNERNARLINVISEQDKLFLLKDMISPLEDEFDWIILDSVPSVNELSKVVLSTSNMTIIPFMPKKLVFDQLASTIRTVQKVKKFYNPDLEITGVLPVAMDHTLKADKEYFEAMEQIASAESLSILPVVKRSTFIEKAADRGKSVIQYRSKDSKQLSEPFRELAKIVRASRGDSV
ncbi:ParA family protein [Exiguobacterium profundum]|uniref:ParA family protein n=1 Tax=Exiguobacterium profundum TaxID=307643 RepID=UPI00339B2DEC